jgi:hypothetical protein
MIKACEIIETLARNFAPGAIASIEFDADGNVKKVTFEKFESDDYSGR